MKMKFLAVAALAIALVVGFGVASAFADGGCKGKGGHGLDDKFYMKAKMALSHEDDLGLSDDQVKKIKDLKHKIKKDVIRADADVEIIIVDIESAMWEDTIDIEAVNKLLDKKYDIMKGKAKEIVAACSELKEILTKEQKDKMKAMMKEHKKAMMCCPMMKEGKCPMMKGKMMGKM